MGHHVQGIAPVIRETYCEFQFTVAITILNKILLICIIDTTNLL